MYWCSTGNTENIMYPKFHNTSFHFMTLQRTGQLFSKRHLENIKPDQCSCCGDITWRSCRDQRLASVESGLTGLESVVVPAGWLAGCEVRRAAVPRSVLSTAGTLWRRSSSRTAARGHKTATPRPAPRRSHSTASASCTPPEQTQGNVNAPHRWRRASQPGNQCLRNATKAPLGVRKPILSEFSFCLLMMCQYMT